MKRVEVMEFEDQPWFPSWLRSCMTNNIVVMPEVMDTLQKQPEFSEVHLTLTDKYPNLPAASVFNASKNGTMRYCKEPIDATTLNSAPAGLKTMVNCFHHMSPSGFGQSKKGGKLGSYVLGMPTSTGALNELD